MYQIEGADAGRCGSLASSGLPVAGVFAADDPVVARGQTFRVKTHAFQRLIREFLVSRERQQCFSRENRDR